METRSTACWTGFRYVLPLLAILVFYQCRGESHGGMVIPTDSMLGDAVAERQVCEQGKVMQAGPVVLTLPAGALVDCLDVSVREESQHPEGSIGPAFRIEPAGTLGKPATISIHLETLGIPPEYLHEGLRLGEVVEGRWVLVPGSVFDASAATLSAPLSRLGVVGVIPRVELDLLWVTENGSAMMRMEAGLVAGFHGLLAQLDRRFPNLSLRFAVTTPADASHLGAFVASPKTSADAAPTDRPCTCASDADCKSAFGEGWRCARSYGYSYPNGTTPDVCVLPCEIGDTSCNSLCTPDLCPPSSHCSNGTCGEDEPQQSPFVCQNYPNDPNSFLAPRCFQLPPTTDCPFDLPLVLEVSRADGVDQSDLIRCLALSSVYELTHPWGGTNDFGFKAAWRALDPSGPNAQQAAAFLRPEAFLLVVFVAYDPECSVDDHFCWQDAPCAKDSDCAPWEECRSGQFPWSESSGGPSFCCGGIPLNFWSGCSLLGEYQGAGHHMLAYDPAGQECQSNSDCQDLWTCDPNHKCQPSFFLSEDRQETPPVRLPRYSLWAVADVQDHLKSLKAKPERVMVAAVAGDTLLKPTDAEMFISEYCLEAKGIPACQAYAILKTSADPACYHAPESLGCEEFNEVRADCARQCWMAVAAMADPAFSTYPWEIDLCTSELGRVKLGARFMELTQRFGPQGFFANMCSPDGSQTMNQMGAWLARAMGDALKQESPAGP